MNLHMFLLIDAVALDIVGVAAIVAGETALGVAFLVLAAGLMTVVVRRTRRRTATGAGTT